MVLAIWTQRTRTGTEQGLKCFNCNKFGGENAKEYIKGRKRKWDRRR